MDIQKDFLLLRACLVLSLGLIFQSVAGPAVAEEEIIQLPINKSRIISLPKKTNQILVGNPDILDFQMIDTTHIFLLGRSLGSTDITLGNSATGYFQTMDVEVVHDIEALKSKLYQLFPNEQPSVFSSQGTIVLSGQVSSPEKMDAMLTIANTFIHKGKQSQGQSSNASSGGAAPSEQSGQGGSADKNQESGVINLMQVGGPQQVMLEVKVAEMSRTLAKNLKVNFNAMQTGGDATGGAISGTASISNLSNLIQTAPSLITPYGLFARLISNDSQFSAVINAARNNGLVKILAEPTLTTISGQEADFLSGGEFPIPVLQQNTGSGGGITITYKEFGIATRFLPVVLDSGRISLKLNIEYSELVNTNTVVAAVNSTQSSFVIPALTKRRANSSVELSDGQTIGIAGLIKDNLRDSVSKFPGLGDIPVLGQLFTSQEFLKDQTELVIFVTPRLARPMPNSNAKLPTDSFVEPNDIEYYLMGRTEGLARRRSPLPMGSGGVKSGGLKGRFGQQQ
jgi:pilus assembly protein CpaC